MEVVCSKKFTVRSVYEHMTRGMMVQLFEISGKQRCP
jgi:hypothetical protein